MGKLEMLNTAGVVVGIDLKDIKSVYFVRDFHETDLLARKTFTTRPRSEGLWVRLRFKDNEILEGTMPVDLTQSPAEGYLVNPPDLRSNTQRIFVPRTALASFTVLAVVGAVKRKRRGVPGELQEKLFEEQIGRVEIILGATLTSAAKAATLRRFYRRAEETGENYKVGDRRQNLPFLSPSRHGRVGLQARVQRQKRGLHPWLDIGRRTRQC